jgi:hypothetical protein
LKHPVLIFYRHYDTVIYTLQLCEWLLYGTYVVTRKKLYVAKRFKRRYFVVKIFILGHNYVGQCYVSI